jgi:hypothetical protein
MRDAQRFSQIGTVEITLEFEIKHRTILGR